MTNTERAMRHLLDQGIWPTAARLNEVGPGFGLKRGRCWMVRGVNDSKSVLVPRYAGRRDLNGPENKTRQRLAVEYGWRRVQHGAVTRWERSAG